MKNQTNKQKEALYIIQEEGSISKHKIHNNTMNALFKKDLVRLSRYANGEFWELTDEGFKFIAKNNILL